MAQVRQADEEFQAAMISCYAEFGLEGVRGIGGGTVLMANLADETGQISAGVQARVDAAAEECNARVPLPEHQAWAFDGAAYQRMIELRECIVARGFEVPALRARSCGRTRNRRPRGTRTRRCWAGRAVRA